MKPDGDTMETTEPTEAAAVAEPSSSQDDTTEEAPSQPEEDADVAPGTIPKGNGKPVAADPKVKPKGAATKTQPAAKSAGPSGSRLGTSSLRTLNDVKSTAALKKTATTTKVSAAGGVPKRPVGAAASSTVKTLSRASDKKPVGPARTTSIATNGTKPTTANGIPKKRPLAETVARPKTTAPAGRAAVSTASKPSTSTTSKAVGATTKPVTSAVSKSTRPTTGPSTSRPASTTSRPTAAAVKPSTTATARTAASRVNTAPLTGRTTAAQPPRTVAAKKDVSRPPSAAVAKKPTAATTSAAAKKNPRPAATVKLNSAGKLSTTKAEDPKVSQTKSPAKSTPSKKPVAAILSQNKQPFGRSPPASPANKPPNSSTPQAKRGPKPPQAAQPFSAAKKTGVSNTTKAAAAAAAAVAVLPETQTDVTESFPQDSALAVSAPEKEETEETPPVLAQNTTPDVEPQEAAPQSPVRTALPPTSNPLMQTESSALPLTSQEQTPAPAEPALPPVACPPDYTEEPVHLPIDQTPSTSKALTAAANAISLKGPPTNLNEEEDEEEREGSQLVSVSEMSGTTQPTEDSRPGSAGPVGGSAWRASGTLLSELDSEEVSGSQQGASELSAPGVLEGTESMDDLGEGSLKGAIDMEGASAGSPDFEKVPDIPANDFDEDDDFDDDRVCDMDVGSERADDPQRLRHDNDANDEEEEDEDVEMASEGVTESGLESYGNADEDDFAEDERLDNLNRVAEPPPPPPQLPSAPAAQWEQPNPFVDPWANPEHQQLLVSQEAGAAAAGPSADPWRADPVTPTQASEQAWLELDSAPLVPENQEAPHQSSVRDEPQNLAPMQNLAPALLSTQAMSLSSTLSSETSTPEELCGMTQDVQAAPLSPQPELDREEAEAETLPADEVLGGPATAPTSNPSSTSVTEDEASDTEGEAQLDDSLEMPKVCHITFDSQSPAQRCLSTVEEGEEADMEAIRAGEDTTPPSATSLASYGFDTMTTASNSNAQSTGESCVRSPGIFSLEELSEEAKEPCLIPPQLGLAEYIECGKQESDSAEPAENLCGGVPGPEEAPDPSSTQSTLQQAEEDVQPAYYSAICEKTENSFAGYTALPQPHRRDHSAYPRTYCDLVKPLVAAPSPKLTCADLPPRNLGQKALSPQLRRLEQHQRQLLEMQHRRDQQSRPLEEAEQERKTREEEEARKKKDEAEEEIKRNKEELEIKIQEQAEVAKKKEEEELKQRRDLELQLQQQQQELKERQQIMQWQQELQQANKEQAELLLSSSVLCTIYEARENSDEEEGEEELKEENEPKEETPNEDMNDSERASEERGDSSPSTESPPPLRDSPQMSSDPSQDGDSSSPFPPESPERPQPLELDWGKKVDIVQQLINQTLLLNRDGCSSLLLLPGGAGGTLSPLESSLWPSLLPPLTPPSATVTSVSCFSPEATGSSPQGEWTVVELETHH